MKPIQLDTFDQELSQLVSLDFFLCVLFVTYSLILYYSKNNCSARPTRAFYALVHFLATKFEVIWRTLSSENRF